MARPIKEGMDYFPHDTDASSDEKIEMLTSIYGNDGYVFYFVMLERIYRNKEFCINISDEETKEEMFQILSKKIRVSTELFTKMLNTSLKYDLFDKDKYNNQRIITSNGVLKRAGPVLSKRMIMQERYERKKNNISETETPQETNSETPQSKEKESKEKEKKKESKEKETTIVNGSSDFNIFTYFQQRGFVSISSMMYEDINTLVDMYSLEEVKQAVDIADKQGKHTLAYIKGVLQNKRAGKEKTTNDYRSEWEKFKETLKEGEDPF